MAKLIYMAIASLDGYVADEDGNFDWAEPDEEVHAFVNDLERPIGTHLYGRRLYEVMIGWETMHTLPDQTPETLDFAAHLAGGREGRLLADAGDGLDRQDPDRGDFDPDGVRRMKAEADRDISIGGATLAGDAIRAGLVDELHLIVNPIVVGGGTPSLPDGVRVEARPARRAPLRQRRRPPALPNEHLAVAFGRDVHDRRVDEPLDRRAIVGVDGAAAQPGRQPRRGLGATAARSGGSERVAASSARAEAGASVPTSTVLVGLTGSRRTRVKTPAHRGAEHLLQAIGVARVADVDEHHAAAASGGRAPRRRTRGSTGRRGCRAGGRRRRRSRPSAATTGAGRGARRRCAGAGSARAGRRAGARRRSGAGSISTAVDAGRREVVAVGARRRARGVAQDRDRARRAPLGGERQHEHLVPVVAGQPLARAVDRVHRLALVELEAPLAVGRSMTRAYWYSVSRLPDHARVAGGLDGPHRDGEQERHPDRRQDEAPLQSRDGDDGQRQREGQERAPRPHERDEQPAR